MSALRRLHPTTKTTICKLRLGTATAIRSPFCSSPSKEPPPFHSLTLTDEELTKINHLIPRLCDSNQLPTALRLTTTALLAKPPLHSLHLSPLIHSLTSHSDLTHTMSLLTHLLHTPQSHPYISPISLLLLSSYLDMRSTNYALKIFRWLQRPNSPCPPDPTMFRLLIKGLCRDGLILQALNALRDMLGVPKFVPCPDSTQCLYRGLLKDARVNEALQLNAALSSLARDAEGKENVLHVLDRIISEWTEIVQFTLESTRSIKSTPEKPTWTKGQP